MVSIWQDAMTKCPHCGATEAVDYRTHEDDEGHEDIEYRCCKCNKTWFVDGPDS